MDTAQLTIDRYGRHHDNCESLKLRRPFRHHRSCTCGYIAARHAADPEWLKECKCVFNVRGESAVSTNPSQPPRPVPMPSTAVHPSDPREQPAPRWFYVALFLLLVVPSIGAVIALFLV